MFYFLISIFLRIWKDIFSIFCGKFKKFKTKVFISSVKYEVRRKKKEFLLVKYKNTKGFVTFILNTITNF